MVWHGRGLDWNGVFSGSIKSIWERTLAFDNNFRWHRRDNQNIRSCWVGGWFGSKADKKGGWLVRWYLHARCMYWTIPPIPQLSLSFAWWPHWSPSTYSQCVSRIEGIGDSIDWQLPCPEDDGYDDDDDFSVCNAIVVVVRFAFYLLAEIEYLKI